MPNFFQRRSPRAKPKENHNHQDNNNHTKTSQEEQQQVPPSKHKNRLKLRTTKWPWIKKPRSKDSNDNPLPPEQSVTLPTSPLTEPLEAVPEQQRLHIIHAHSTLEDHVVEATEIDHNNARNNESDHTDLSFHDESEMLWDLNSLAADRTMVVAAICVVAIRSAIVSVVLALTRLEWTSLLALIVMETMCYFLQQGLLRSMQDIVGSSFQRRTEQERSDFDMSSFIALPTYPRVSPIPEAIQIVVDDDNLLEDDAPRVPTDLGPNIQDRAWRIIVSPTIQRWGCGMACGMACGDYKLFMAGGWNIKTNEPLNSIEMYNFRSNTWDQVQGLELAHNRAECTAIVVHGHLYVFGGVNSEGYVLSVEIFDLQQQQQRQSRMVLPMHDNCAGLSPLLWNESIYLIGMEDRSLRYNIAERTFHHVPLNLPWRTIQDVFRPLPVILNNKILNNKEQIMIIDGNEILKLDTTTDEWEPTRSNTTGQRNVALAFWHNRRLVAAAATGWMDYTSSEGVITLRSNTQLSLICTGDRFCSAIDHDKIICVRGNGDVVFLSTEEDDTNTFGSLAHINEPNPRIVENPWYNGTMSSLDQHPEVPKASASEENTAEITNHLTAIEDLGLTSGNGATASFDSASSLEFARVSKGRLFINHTGQDKDAKMFANMLWMILEYCEYRCFFDIKSLEPGRRWKLDIEKSIRECDIFLCLISKEWYFRHWCMLELDAAVRNDRTIIPIYTDHQCFPYTKEFETEFFFRHRTYDKADVSFALITQFWKNLVFVQEIQTIQSISWERKDGLIEFVHRIMECIDQEVQQKRGNKGT